MLPLVLLLSSKISQIDEIFLSNVVFSDQHALRTILVLCEQHSYGFLSLARMWRLPFVFVSTS